MPPSCCLVREGFEPSPPASHGLAFGEVWKGLPRRGARWLFARIAALLVLLVGTAVEHHAQVGPNVQDVHRCSPAGCVDLLCRKTGAVPNGPGYRAGMLGSGPRRGSLCPREISEEVEDERVGLVRCFQRDEVRGARDFDVTGVR